MDSALLGRIASARPTHLGAWMMKKLLVALPLVALVAACGSGSGGGAASQLKVVGSSTVYPFTTAVAEEFHARQPRNPRDRRIDRHRRGHQAILRWRRRAVPRHGQCIPPDEGERICRLRQGRRQTGHRSAGRHRRPDPDPGERPAGAQPDGRANLQGARRQSLRQSRKPRRPGRISIPRFRRRRSASSARRRRPARATAWPS